LKTGTQRNGTNFTVSTSIFQVAFHWFLAVDTSLNLAVSKTWLCVNSSLYPSDRVTIPASKQPENEKIKVWVSCKNYLQKSICDFFLRCFHSTWKVLTP